MLTRNTKNSLIMYFLFWAIYAPVALICWINTDGTLLYLSIVLLIGLGIVLLGLFIKETYLDRRPFRLRSYRRTFLELEDDFELDEDDLEPEPPEVSDDAFTGFRSLFSDDKQPGGEAT